MSKFNLIPVVILLSLVLACGPSQPERAGQKIGIAEDLLHKGDTLNALLHLDSIPRIYPEALLESKRAAKIGNEIRILKMNNLHESLSKAKVLIDSVTKDFTSEKGEFEKYANYIHKSRGIDKDWARSYIQVIVNEQGDLSLLSNYYGDSWINHTSVRIEGDGLTVKTDSVASDNVNNHHSEFNGAKWEKVTYHGILADKVVEVISANPDKKLKVFFKGKNSYVIWLEESDKKAIKSTYELSKALKVKVEAEKAISDLEKKMKPE